MANKLDHITDKLKSFIDNQKIFFVGTAPKDGRVNVSPKGMDTLRVIDMNTIYWLNLTGSGNETAAHVQENERMTMMFCAFEGKPLILRLYGNARFFGREDPEWSGMSDFFSDIPGARQIFEFKVDLVQTSCGFAVPLYSFERDREHLVKWALNKGEKGLDTYRAENNTRSLDGKAIPFG
jgi:pyridoxamine 5'-phosphate oxidase-like protein